MSPENHGKPWLSSEVDGLLDQFHNGMAPASIAAAHNRTVNAVVGKLTGLHMLTVVGRAYHRVEPDPWVTFDEIRSLK